MNGKTQKLSVLSWNVQGLWNLTGHTSFGKVKPHLAGSSFDIIALQEMRAAEEILGKEENFKEYEVFIPKLNNFGDSTPGYNHNILLGRHPIIQAAEMAFPDWGQRVNLENCTRVDIKLEEEVLRIYNCHFAIYKVGIATRLRQIGHVLADSLEHAGPVIICGDMNVTMPGAGWNRKVIAWWHREPMKEMYWDDKLIDYDEKELFSEIIGGYGFKEALDLCTPTWSPFKSRIWEVCGLKLDWFMVKGLEIEKAELGDYVSDHRAVMAECRVQPTSSRALPKMSARRLSADAIL